MTDEDQFVYLFTHFAKHYRNGGGGCRHVVDLWVYLRHYSNLDMAYIRQELKVLELDAFFENMLALIAAWFGDGQWSPVTEFMSEVIFANGNWGNAKTHSIAELLRKQHKGDSAGRGKLRWLLWRVFPPCRALCGEYQVLKKWPVLLPLVWIVRWVKTLFAHRNKIKRDLNILVETSTEEIEAQERALFYVGLKFEK